MLKTRGLNHIDLGTKDMEATRAFYEGLLGFPLVRADLVEIGDNGRLKHFFFDIGNGQLMGFMSGEDVHGYPKDFDAGINKGLGLAPGVYHFAFDAETEQDLSEVPHPALLPQSGSCVCPPAATGAACPRCAYAAGVARRPLGLLTM